MSDDTRIRTIANGYYRLVARSDVRSPLFPQREQIVQVKAGRVVNVGTGHSLPIRQLKCPYYLYGPLQSPFDNTRVSKLRRIDIL